MLSMPLIIVSVLNSLGNVVFTPGMQQLIFGADQIPAEVTIFELAVQHFIAPEIA